MRHALLAGLALLAAGCATIAGSGAAVAFDYPWCIQARGVVSPGNCAYRSYAECTAVASPRGAHCNANRRVAVERTRFGRSFPNEYYD
jgi:hypothetical protein